MIAVVFAATVIATTAAHCDLPAPPAEYPESATLEVLNGPVVKAGDTLRLRVGLNDEVAPTQWTLSFTNPYTGAREYWYEGFPDGECAALSARAIPNTNPSVDFSAEVECSLPAYVENGTWSVAVIYDRGRIGPTVTFEVTGGSDDRSGPTVQFTEVPTQPVAAGQSFEVAARVADPNGIALANQSLYFPYGPICEAISDVPYPSFDVEVRFRCDTTTAGTYVGTLVLYDLMWRLGRAPTSLSVTIT